MRHPCSLSQSCGKTTDSPLLVLSQLPPDSLLQFDPEQVYIRVRLVPSVCWSSKGALLHFDGDHWSVQLQKFPRPQRGWIRSVVRQRGIWGISEVLGDTCIRHRWIPFWRMIAHRWVLKSQNLTQSYEWPRNVIDWVARGPLKESIV